MFYVKEQLNDAMEVSIEINDENVFCRCPHCGSEVQVDLAEVFADGDVDLFGTAVLCDKWSRGISPLLRICCFHSFLMITI